uniref:Uncharacterized protein n=1 Tax=Cannabis sativa TaxID=3483 RepID=A0A803QH25_CANSA
MAKRFNMVLEPFPPLSANMASTRISKNGNQTNSNTSKPQNQQNGAFTFNQPRNNSDEPSLMYFNHNMLIKTDQIIQDRAPPPQFLSDADQDSNTFNLEFLDWEVQDQLMVSWFLSSMTESLLTRMVGCHTSRQIWNALEKHLTLQHVDLLAWVGEVLSARDYIATIFKGLPSEYDTFIISSNTRIEEYSIVKIEALLLPSESRIEKTYPDQDSHLSANLTIVDSDQATEANIAYKNIHIETTSSLTTIKFLPPYPHLVEVAVGSPIVGFL